MTWPRRGRLQIGLWRPKTTVRWRLTLLYGALFLASGTVLLAVTYSLVDHASLGGPSFVRAPLVGQQVPPGAVREQAPAGPGSHVASGTLTGPDGRRLPAQVLRLLHSRNGQLAVRAVGSAQRISDLHSLVIESAIALAIMAVISTALGWLVAGRVLAPLRTMTMATREIGAANLDERLAMEGPQDELRQLADTIDGLLERLEGAFDAQRRFVANASHELRTPLTAARALLEMVLSDPHATVATFRTTCEQVLEESDQQEQLIDALLALAQGQRGIDRPEPVDLAAVVSGVALSRRSEAGARGLGLDVALEPAVLAGDRRLIERLASNLVDNALRYNIPDGQVSVRVSSLARGARLTVSNTGPVVPSDEVERLLAPFQRMGVSRVGHGDGLGLGLSIVAAIASAHDATLDVVAGVEGGLDVHISFPPPTAGELPPAPAGADLTPSVVGS
ncbi:MAG TPA: HAMP domain-containing sensor histidine kinase [Solirubrobacteraceae bacterium]|nr:HAMP domain-containing sensor histidine kinase [Solirubrobacteraceae bacterium]